MRNVYAISTRLACTILLGGSLVFSLGNSPLNNLGFQVDLAFGFRFGALVALIGGIAYGIRTLWQFAQTSSALISGAQSDSSPEAETLKPTENRGAGNFLLVGGFALILGGVIGTIAGLGDHWITTFMELEIGMFLAISFGFRRSDQPIRNDIVIAESLHWSALSFFRSLIFTVPIVVCLAASALNIESPTTGLVLGAISFALGTLVGGLQRKVVEKRSQPNQGIVGTARRALLLGGAGAMTTMVLVGSEYGWS